MSLLTQPKQDVTRVSVGGRRWRAAGLLWRPVRRLVPWWHLAAGAAMAFVVVWHARGEPYATVDSMVSALRFATIPLVLSAGFLLDDPTEDTLAGTPVVVGVRRALRLVPAVVILALVWWGLLALAETTPAIQEALAERSDAGIPEVDGWALPWVALTAESVALLGLGFAAAGYGLRLSADRSGGMVATATVLAAVVVAYLLPPRWALMVRPGAAEEMWLAAHHRWAWIAALALALLVQASRDPGRMRLMARFRSATGGTT